MVLVLYLTPRQAGRQAGKVVLCVSWTFLAIIVVVVVVVIIIIIINIIIIFIILLVSLLFGRCVSATRYLTDCLCNCLSVWLAGCLWRR